MDSATAALDSLDRLEPKKKAKTDKGAPEVDHGKNEVVEIEGEDDAAESAELEKLRVSDERRRDILRIRSKALMRRAKAKMELGGWGNLQGAEDGMLLPQILPYRSPSSSSHPVSYLPAL